MKKKNWRGLKENTEREIGHCYLGVVVLRSRLVFNTDRRAVKSVIVGAVNKIFEGVLWEADLKIKYNVGTNTQI